MTSVESAFEETVLSGQLPVWSGLCLATLFLLIWYIRARRSREKFYGSIGKLTSAGYFAGIVLLLFLCLWAVGLLYEVTGRSTSVDVVGKTFSFAFFYLVCVLLAISVYKVFRKKELSRKRLLWAALTVWSAGFILYFIGFFSEGTQFSPAALIIRPALSAAELFVSTRDLLEVADSCKENPVYMGAFAIVSATAIIVSASFLISLTGIRIKAWVRLKTMRLESDEALYLFWGPDQASLTLAKDIQRRYAGGRAADIVFIDYGGNEDDDQGGRLSLGHIINMFLIRRKSYKAIRDKAVEASLCICDRELRQWRTDSASEDFETMMRNAGLSDVLRMMRDAAKVHVFFLSEDENLNIENTMIFSDVLGTSSGELQEKTVVYCHACLERINAAEALLRHEAPKVHVVDSAMLAVNELRSDSRMLPVGFVEPDTDRGIATKPFNSMIVGFGETGEEVLGFLYEFGAFVGKDGRRNEFRCRIVDPDAEALKERFLMRNPAFKESWDLCFENTSETRSGYWDRLRGIIDELDYVVVTIGDDGRGLSLAADIYSFALRYRTASGRFSVAVRVRDSVYYKRAMKIQEYFAGTGNGGAENWQFVIFGTMEQLLTYDNVLDDRALLEARRFFKAYQESSGDDVISWEDRRRFLLGTGLEDYNKLLMQERQDISNSRHVETKMLLAGVHDKGDKKLTEMLKAIEGRDVSTTVYPNATPQQAELLKNLAECEHLRWVAACMMMGYVTYDIGPEDGNQKDYRRKRLSCMVSCERMQAIPSLRDTIKYDYDVVDVSFKIKGGVL